METVKAGCFLFDKNTRKIALVYREKQNDYSFPKGHLEEGEDLKTCAIRETNEETKRNCEIIDEYPPFIERYTTKTGEKCICYMFIAREIGKSDNTSEDTHTLCWTDYKDVSKILSYVKLKKVWKAVKGNVLKEMNKN